MPLHFFSFLRRICEKSDIAIAFTCQHIVTHYVLEDSLSPTLAPTVYIVFRPIVIQTLCRHPVSIITFLAPKLPYCYEGGAFSFHSSQFPTPPKKSRFFSRRSRTIAPVFKTDGKLTALSSLIYNLFFVSSPPRKPKKTNLFLSHAIFHPPLDST